jgi:hypothetical protein
MPYTDWTAGLNKLVNETEGMWKEEALWLAGWRNSSSAALSAPEQLAELARAT